jgi:uncharacterized protein (TIGR03067 family)
LWLGPAEAGHYKLYQHRAFFVHPFADMVCLDKTGKGTRIMQAKLLACFLLVLFISSGCSSKPTEAGSTATGWTQPVDLQALQGEWEVVSAESNGSPPPPEMKIIGSRFAFSGNTLTFLSGKKVSFTLDSSKRPRQIDLGRNKQQLGIYELDGDTLKMCIGPADDRPKEFSTKPRTDHSFFLLKRKG